MSARRISGPSSIYSGEGEISLRRIGILESGIFVDRIMSWETDSAGSRNSFKAKTKTKVKSKMLT
jgi:hypothetical protein